MKKLAVWIVVSLLAAPLTAWAQKDLELETATSSALAEVKLPANVFRVKTGTEPKELRDALKAFIDAGGAGVKQGRSEILGWGGNYKKANAPQLQKAFSQSLKDAGWTYEEGEKATAEGLTVTPVSALRRDPQPRALIGFWAPTDESLLLAWTEMLRADTPAPPADKPAPAKNLLAANNAAPANASAAPAGAKVIDVPFGARNINVMKGINPKIPEFPALTPKPGFVRGYVKDWTGKPLANAKLGVRSTAVGGAYSGGKGKTDEKGYYEFPVPFGVASFYAGAYTVDWGDGRAALSLHPADGELDGFASNVGGVENFVLLTYGISNRDRASENPGYSGNYYGGTFSIDYSTLDGANDTYHLPSGGQLEVTLAPQGTLLDGSKGQSFVLRRKTAVGDRFFYVNNVPLGTYKISVTLDGKPLAIKEVGPYRNNDFGLDPKEGRGSATLTFRPGGAQAETTTPQNGNWNSLDVRFEP